MKSTQWIAPIVLSASAALAGPPVPETPLAVQDIILARPFTLEPGYQTFWRKEAPVVTQGYLLVLDVTPAAVYPRQTHQPVLYVGSTTVEPFNVGYISGKIIAMVPGPIDLKTSPIWFGTPALPEQVDAAIIIRERVAAEGAGIRPFAADKVDLALARGGKPIAGDSEEMLRTASALVKEFSSDEVTQADGLSNDPAQITAAAPASGILWAQTFSLAKGFGSGQMLVKQGSLVVLDVNPDLVFQREDGQVPTLFVNGIAAERVNIGYISGKVVAIVPGSVDLAKAVFWFGKAGMDRSSVKPFAGEAVSKALALGGTGSYADKAELLAAAADQIRAFAPDEFNLADSLSAGSGQ